MQVTETSAEGLKRQYHIVVPAGELEDKVTQALGDLNRAIRLPGFRPGKVPLQILRQRFGRSVLGEVVENTVQGSSADTIRDHNLRPALPPKVDIVSFGEGADLEYNMSVEVLPEIPEPNFAELEIERLAVDVPDRAVDKAIERIAEQQRKSEPVDRPAEEGDIIVFDVEGKTGGEVIAGATGKDRRITLGSSGYVPGFDEQLVGAKAGEHRTVTTVFPEDFGAADLAGKEAVFEVDVKEVQGRLPAVVDDTLAEEVGLETLAELRQEVRQQMEREYAQIARARLKRALLDKLAERYDFPVPPGMVDMEFENIWQQRQAERERDKAAQPEAAAPPAERSAAGEAPSAAPAAPAPVAGDADAAAPAADAAADDEKDKTEYRDIAERRVRLGLLLAEVGRNNNITVSPEEVNQAVARAARAVPGYERQMIEFYRQTPEAVDRLRAPIFEDKVVDFIVELAKLPERKVTPEELTALPDPLDEPEEAGPA
jgi:trigger factor